MSLVGTSTHDLDNGFKLFRGGVRERDRHFVGGAGIVDCGKSSRPHTTYQG